MLSTLRKTVLAAAIAMIAVVAFAVPTDLAVNGGFETGDFTGWDQFPSGPAQQTIITPGASGTYAACVDNTVLASASVIKNSFLGAGLVMPGQVVTINFDARGQGAVGGVAFAELFSEIDGGGVSKSEILGGAPLALNADPNVWTNFNFVTTLGPDVSGGVTFQLACITGAAQGSVMNVCIDNLTVTADVVVSVEESSWSNVKALYD